MVWKMNGSRKLFRNLAKSSAIMHSELALPGAAVILPILYWNPESLDLWHCDEALVTGSAIDRAAAILPRRGNISGERARCARHRLIAGGDPPTPRQVALVTG
jgi:hypothetical protein